MSTVGTKDSQRETAPWKATTEPARSDVTIDLERVNCLHCGGNRYDTVVVTSDFTTHVGGTFCVVRCRDCQLAFTNPRPTLQSISAFYPDDYGPFVGREWDDRRTRCVLEQAVLHREFGYPPQRPNRRTALLSRLGRLIIRRNRQRQSWIPYREPGRLLDFGCGCGRFLEKMKKFGWTVEGLDICPWVARQVETRTGVPVHVGTLPHPKLVPESYDTITMWNSLEHVHQPHAVLGAARELLCRGGLLVVAVPNFASWSFHTFRENWYALELPRHLVHFTPQTACSLLAAEKFKVLSVDHVGRFGWIRKSLKRAASNGQSSWRLQAYRYKHFGLRLAHWTERTRQADSIRIIAQKL